MVLYFHDYCKTSSLDLCTIKLLRTHTDYDHGTQIIFGLMKYVSTSKKKTKTKCFIKMNFFKAYG